MTSKRLEEINKKTAIYWAIAEGRKRREIAAAFGVTPPYIDLLKRQLRAKAGLEGKAS